MVHSFVFDQAKLPKRRHAYESAGHFLDRKELIDELQHSGKNR